MNHAKKIGIIYILNSNETYDLVSNFVKHLQGSQKKVKAIGLVEKKSDTERFLPKLSYDFIYHKDINWYGKPKGHYTEDFLKEDFDILIDISRNGNYAMEYLFALSGAKMKITHRQQSGQRQYYDLLIQWDKTKSLDVYLEEVMHYLSIIKPKQSTS